MYYILGILVCVAIAGLFARFISKITSILLILFSLALISILIMPLAWEVGLFCLTICVGLFGILAVSWLLSSIITLLVVAPFLLLWSSIKSLFTK